MYYSGIIPDAFRKIRYRTVMNEPFEEVKENFRGSEHQKNFKEEVDFLKSLAPQMLERYIQDSSSAFKPRIGLWGSFEFGLDNPDELYPWENFEIYNHIRNYDNGVYGIDYNLPEGIKVLIVDDSKGDYAKVLKDYGYNVQKIVDEYDVFIETSGNSFFDVPSVCIFNKETLERLEILDYFIKNDFESERKFFIKDGKEYKESKFDFDGYILNLSEEEKTNPEVINKVIEEFFKLEDSIFYSEEGFRKYPKEMFETLKDLNLNEMKLKDIYLDNDKKKYFGDN